MLNQFAYLRSDGAENLAGARQAVDMDALGVDWFVRAVDKYVTWQVESPLTIVDP